MNYWHSITIGSSLVVLFWSVWASFRARKPWNHIGSFLAPIAMLTAILGVLLLCVPDFFS
ncbi:hypothetical protein JXA80_08885 [bacterium]|nr:hypothetical protein [candidate division CSSED10-310 bacterium]